MMKRVGTSQEALEAAEQEQWASTAMVVLLLVHWRVARRRLLGRSNAAVILGALLEEAVPVDTIQGLAPFSLGAESLAKCQAAPKHDGECACVRQGVTKARLPPPDGRSKQAYLAEAIFFLYGLRDCPAIRSHIGELLSTIASAVRAAWSSWGNADWQRSKAAKCMAAQRSRRADFHLKQFALVGSREQGKTTSVGQAVQSLHSTDKSLAVKWREQEMSAYRASCLLSFTGAQCLSVCLDAARVGSPSKEMLAGFVTAPRLGLHCAFPPQVVQ